MRFLSAKPPTPTDLLPPAHASPARRRRRPNAWWPYNHDLGLRTERGKFRSLLRPPLWRLFWSPLMRSVTSSLMAKRPHRSPSVLSETTRCGRCNRRRRTVASPIIGPQNTSGIADGGVRAKALGQIGNRQGERKHRVGQILPGDTRNLHPGRQTLYRSARAADHFDARIGDSNAWSGCPAHRRGGMA